MRLNGKKSDFVNVILFLVVMILFVTACSGDRSKRYHELIDSYSKDPNYRQYDDAPGKTADDPGKNTDAPDKNTLTPDNSPAVPALNPSVGTAIGRVLSNAGSLRGIPIPTYHCIEDNIWGMKSMFVSPASFDRQMKYLKDKGFTAVTFQDLPRINQIKKPIMITFDDGYEDNYTNAYPILKKYGFKATVFLIADVIDTPRCLKLREIRQMQDIIDFQSHTMTHKHLADLDQTKIEYELSESKNKLEKLLNKKVDAIAYPYGSYDSRVVNTAKKYYKYGLTTDFGRFFNKPADEYLIKRINILEQTDYKEFVKLFQ